MANALGQTLEQTQTEGLIDSSSDHHHRDLVLGQVYNDLPLFPSSPRSSLVLSGFFINIKKPHRLIGINNDRLFSLTYFFLFLFFFFSFLFLFLSRGYLCGTVFAIIPIHHNPIVPSRFYPANEPTNEPSGHSGLQTHNTHIRLDTITHHIALAIVIVIIAKVDDPSSLPFPLLPAGNENDDHYYYNHHAKNESTLPRHHHHLIVPYPTILHHTIDSTLQ